MVEHSGSTQDPASLRASRARIAQRFSQARANTLTTSEVLGLSAEEMVVLVGAPSCAISGVNIMKQIPPTPEGARFLRAHMPQLVDANGNWDARLNCAPPAGVDFPEILAGFTLASRIAHERGIPLSDVRMEDLQASQLRPIYSRLTNAQLAATCEVTTPTTPLLASLEQFTQR